MDSSTPKALPLIRSARLRRELTNTDVEATIGAFRKDLANRVFDMKRFGAEVFRKASLLSASQTPQLGRRALDVLHVASAIVLGAKDFYTFDRNQAKLADIQGLVVKGY